jgi:flagellar hook-basal body protein
MSLYGALFGGVAGLRAQSSRIGAISDNIANVNTVGYKQSRAVFQTLVVNGSSTVSYQTGGVRATTRTDVSRQGLLQTTETPTDIAISGGGFFVARAVAEPVAGDANSLPVFTRAGSFRQDSLGNFINSQGYFLQGWPLDRNGNLPGEPGNLNTIASTNFDSLTTVNLESASGVAQATTNVELGANLNAGEVTFAGIGTTAGLDQLNAANVGINAEAIIAGDEYGLASTNNLQRGDMFQIVTGNGLSYTYEYGGYSVGRDITNAIGAANFGDSLTDNTVPLTIAAGAANIQVGADQQSIVITLAGHNVIPNDVIQLAGVPALGFGGFTQAQLQAPLTVLSSTAGTVTVRISLPATGTAAGTSVNPGGLTADTRQYDGTMLDAATPTQAFLATTGTAGFSTAARSFTIQTASAGTKTFTYTTSSPNALGGEFNSLNTLASAISEVNGLTARVISGRLVVSASDANEAILFANGDVNGVAGTSRGINWVDELGLQDQVVGNRRFNTLQGLANIVNSDTGVSAVVSNPLANASLAINVDDPLDTLTFQDLPDPPFSIAVGTALALAPAGAVAAGSAIDITIPIAPPANLNVGDQVRISGFVSPFAGLGSLQPNGGPFEVVATTAGDYTIRVITPSAVTVVSPSNVPVGSAVEVNIVGESNRGSLLAQLGIVASLNGATYTPQTTGILGPRYDSSGAVGDNMASGDITAQFSRNVRIFDSLGTGHDLRFSFLKIAANVWAAELHSIPDTAVNTPLPNGQLAVGTIEFNGDGTLRSVSSGLTVPVSINWNNGAVPSEIQLDLGTPGQPFGTAGATEIGLTDGLSQFDSSYNVAFANQNGAPVGQLVSVAINNEGKVIASYSNGETQELYQLPIADFANPDGLQSRSGNVFTQTQESGEANLREAGSNGTGTVVSAALEQSNVDLAEQLTDMIVAQRAYQANTKVISTTDQLLEQLNQLVR